MEKFANPLYILSLTEYQESMLDEVQVGTWK